MDQTLKEEFLKLETYLANQGEENFLQDVRSLDSSGLEEKFLTLSKHAQEILNGKAQDQDLKAAIEKKKELEKPYSRQMLMNSKKSRFISLLKKEKYDE